MGEQKLVFRSGDQLRVVCGLITLSGEILSIRPDGQMVCLMDGTDGSSSIGPTLCRIEVTHLNAIRGELL